jgi:hypothetical protein
MGSVDDDRSLVDHASAPIESPVDLSTNLAGQIPRFPAIFFVLAASSPGLGRATGQAASGPTIRFIFARRCNIFSRRIDGGSQNNQNGVTLFMPGVRRIQTVVPDTAREVMLGAARCLYAEHFD